jgi:hypothetical protein
VAVDTFRYAATGTTSAFDWQTDWILGCEQKQFAELAQERQRGYKSQDVASQTARQLCNKRNTRADRANANV